ncbi:MAG: class I adenylate-forming enzyme family protein [Acidimicrobiales bacterium]
MPELVAIDLEAGPAWVDAVRRIWDGGNAALPLDRRLAAPARAAVLAGLGAGAVVDAAGRTPLGAGRPVEPGDALVMATSGTTGEPKGVVLTHDAVTASALATSARLGVDPAMHRWLACLPLSHVGGLTVITKALATGATLTVLPGFDRDAVLAASGPEVLVSLVPTALRRVGAGHFHTVVLGGSAPPDRLPANVRATYGMTETGSGVVYDGLPLDGVEVSVDPADGQIRLRGPMLLRSYRDGTRPFDADGWFATGDAGRWLDGRLVVDGRLSELIITGGENVWPASVEAILAQHPSVGEVAVAGRPDEEWGERVVAWVVPAAGTPPPTLDALRALVRERLAAFAAPRELVVVPALPKTAIGKLQRGRLT